MSLSVRVRVCSLHTQTLLKDQPSKRSCFLVQNKLVLLCGVATGGELFSTLVATCRARVFALKRVLVNCCTFSIARTQMWLGQWLDTWFLKSGWSLWKLSRDSKKHHHEFTRLYPVYPKMHTVDSTVSTPHPWLLLFGLSLGFNFTAVMVRGTWTSSARIQCENLVMYVLTSVYKIAINTIANDGQPWSMCGALVSLFFSRCSRH